MAVVRNIKSSGGTSITVVANYSALPDPTTVSGKFYWCENSQGTSWLPGSLGGTYYNSGLYYSNGVSWNFMNVPYQATQNEVNSGTNNNKFITPLTFENAEKFKPVIVSSNITAILNRVHNVVANATLTDATPVEGMGYTVNVINGVATVGGVAYSVGSELYRHYHSGSWRTAEYVNGKELERFVYSDGDGVLGITHTGNTLETVLFSIPITAGYFQVKDWMNAFFSINKPTPTTNNVTCRMRIGTTGTTADNLLATFVTNQRNFAFSRYNMQFLTGDIIRAVNSLAGTQTDLNAASVISNVSVNPSNAFYLTITAQLTESTEQVRCIGARVSRIKPSN